MSPLGMMVGEFQMGLNSAVCAHNPEVAGSNPAPRYQEVQVRGVIAREAIGPFDRLSAVRPRDLASEHGTSRSGQAVIGIAAQGSARRCGLIGADRGILLAARATPSRDRVVPSCSWQPSDFGLDDPQVSQTGFDHRAGHCGYQACRRQGPSRRRPPGGWVAVAGLHALSRRLPGEAAPRCQPLQTALLGPGARQPAWRGRAAVAITNVPDPPECNARRTAEAPPMRGPFRWLRPFIRIVLAATGWLVYWLAVALVSSLG